VPLVAAVIGAVILAGIPAMLIGKGNGSSPSPAVEGTNINALGNVTADPGTPSAGVGEAAPGVPASPSTSAAGRPSVSPSASGAPHGGPGRTPAAGQGSVSSAPAKTTAAVSQPAPKTVSGTRVLNRGDSIVNGPTTLKLDSGGNLVVTYAGAAKWSSGTKGQGVRAVFQADGNLVVYAADNSTVWSSRTDGHNGAVLVIGGNGNVYVTYENAVLWQTGTAS
jgi:hypothetical protein